MTRINAPSPVPYVLPNDTRSHSSTRVVTTRDFPTLLSAQPQNPQSPADAENTPSQPESVVQMPSPQDNKTALEQLLAPRIGRSAFGAAAPLPDGSFNDDPLVDSPGTVDLACAAERSAVLRAEYIRGMNARRGFCWNGLVDDFPAECAPNDPAMTEEPPVSIVVWIPVERVRSPAQ